MFRKLRNVTETPIVRNYCVEN